MSVQFYLSYNPNLVFQVPGKRIAESAFCDPASMMNYARAVIQESAFLQEFRRIEYFDIV